MRAPREAVSAALRLADWMRGYRGAFVAIAALFVVTFLWLYPAPILLSHQGRQSLLTAQSLKKKQ